MESRTTRRTRRSRDYGPFQESPGDASQTSRLGTLRAQRHLARSAHSSKASLVPLSSLSSSRATGSVGIGSLSRQSSTVSSAMGHLHNLFAALSVFWALLYAFRHFRRRSSKQSLLPSPTSSSKSQSSDLLRTPTTRITLSNFHLGLHSTAFNPLLHHFATRLKSSRWRKLLNLVYDTGSALGVLGMLGSIVLLIWTTLQLFSSVNLNRDKIHFPSAVLSFHKRESWSDQPSSALPPSESRDPPLQLIVSVRYDNFRA